MGSVDVLFLPVSGCILRQEMLGAAPESELASMLGRRAAFFEDHSGGGLQPLQWFDKSSGSNGQLSIDQYQTRCLPATSETWNFV